METTTLKDEWRVLKMHVELEIKGDGSAIRSRKTSVGAFFWWERIDSITVNLYEYCLGHGIAGWEISAAPHKIRVKDFALTPTNINVMVGDTAHLTAIITPANADDQDITWRFSPTNRNTKLKASGTKATLTSTKTGTYTVTATLGDFQATCEVNFVEEMTGVEDTCYPTDAKQVHP